MLKLDIQLFAEDGTAPAENNNETAETNTSEPKSEEVSFTELLKNPKYQAEFDKLVDKSLNTAKSKWEEDFTKKMEAERTEAEKLAKMDADQKLKYELKKSNDEKVKLQQELDAINLYKTASSIANEKELPLGYLELIDFKNETADGITSKIEKLEELRSKDLQSYLNNKLKQNAPTEKKEEGKKIDPYVAGFLNELEN